MESEVEVTIPRHEAFLLEMFLFGENEGILTMRLPVTSGSLRADLTESGRILAVSFGLDPDEDDTLPKAVELYARSALPDFEAKARVLRDRERSMRGEIAALHRQEMRLSGRSASLSAKLRRLGA